MRRLFFAMVATCALFFSACSNVESDGAYTDQTGSISIDLGSSTRGLVTFDSTTVTWYKLEVTGNGKTYKDEGAPGSKIKFENLSIGVYTVLCEAYMGEAKIQIAIAEANVVAGETADVVLKFKKENLLSTKFMMINKDKHKIYDDVKGVPLDFKLTADNFDFQAKSFAEAEYKDGNVYYARDTYDSDWYLFRAGDKKWELDLNNANGDVFSDYVSNILSYYDAVGDVFYIFVIRYDGKKYILSVDIEEKRLKLIGQIDLEYSSSYQEIFSVCKDLFFLIRYDEGAYRIAKGIISENNINITEDVLLSDLCGSNEYGNVEIKDMKIAEEGKILILMSQNYDISRQIILNNSADVFSRGAIMEVSYGSEGFGKSRIGGWFGDSMARTLQQNGIKPSVVTDNGKELIENLTLYGPSKAQRKDYFCGPKRIVCIRPKEVYIVDEGVNVRLADWTKRHEDCHDFETNNPDIEGAYQADSVGQSGNMFRINRVVKVNLETFAMHTEIEHVEPWVMIKINEDGGRAKYSAFMNAYDFGLFDSITISCPSSQLGYVESTTGYLGIHPFMEEDEN